MNRHHGRMIGVQDREVFQIVIFIPKQDLIFSLQKTIDGFFRLGIITDVKAIGWDMDQLLPFDRRPSFELRIELRIS